MYPLQRLRHRTLACASYYATCLLYCAIIQTPNSPRLAQAFSTFNIQEQKILSSCNRKSILTPSLYPFGTTGKRMLHLIRNNNTTRHLSSTHNEINDNPEIFRRGDKIQVEVTRFGYLGASVDVIGHNSHDEKDLIPEDQPPLGRGLILQKEIKYFRDARDGLDVITGEILPAYVEGVREEDGKLNISLRIPGGKGKADELANHILDKLKQSENGIILVGDKSSPGEISRAFPGSSKASFKRAVAALYKKGLVKPGPDSICLI
eukprot:CAMPEP_0184869372 /NCGR_PEP_ID=MMETSP0580-20130426/33828_1 /TAXON_ID=1118495 /ORGANISM="Dactyliosolen fragilissimus" /LENGTH=262 /DNA_ID=CAMNT_0027370821 /DNA_START=27 /DNA_END=815 /DNA_ORIENTATION=-